MKIFILALSLYLALSTPAFAFQTGKWTAKNGEWQAEIEIRKDNALYKANFTICAQARPKVEACYGAENAEARQSGHNLQVKVDNKIGIEIEPAKQGIKVYTDFTKIKFNVSGENPDTLVSNKELNAILLAMEWKRQP